MKGESVVTRTRKWVGIVVLVLALIAMVLIGFSDWPEAVSAPARSTTTTAQRTPVCDNCSTVSNKWEGARKFRHNRLGHAPRIIKYPPDMKRVIINKMQRRMNSRSARGPGGGYWTRAEVWQKFITDDGCVLQRYGAATSNATYKCSTDRTPWKLGVDVKPWEVRLLMCGGLAGVSVGGALAGSAFTGPAAPWVAGAIIGGFAVCQWGGYLERQAN